MLMHQHPLLWCAGDEVANRGLVGALTAEQVGLGCPADAAAIAAIR
jgi:hypothetical protein